LVAKNRVFTLDPANKDSMIWINPFLPAGDLVTAYDHAYMLAGVLSTVFTTSRVARDYFGLLLLHEYERTFAEVWPGKGVLPISVSGERLRTTKGLCPSFSGFVNGNGLRSLDDILGPSDGKWAQETRQHFERWFRDLRKTRFSWLTTKQASSVPLLF